MASEVWGTCAVNDHQRREAFLREILLFDRLVVPVPSSDEERNRWRQPNPNDPNETWNPDRLEELLSVLGTQHAPGHNGAQLVWTSPWDKERWQAERARREVADAITNVDAFGATRLVLAMDEQLPGVVEAVAAYPSEMQCREEYMPSAQPPPDITAANALVMLARPLLVPDFAQADQQQTFREAIELACDSEFKAARAEYHSWLREFVKPLQQEDAGLQEVDVDAASLELARQRLQELMSEERRLVTKDRARSGWRRVEWVTMVIGVSVGTGLALMNPLAGLGAAAAIGQFGGWVAARRAAPPEHRPLSGASMFVTAERQRGWTEAIAP